MNAGHATTDIPSTIWLTMLAGELTAAVYTIALQYGQGRERWLELELALWKAVTDTLEKWHKERPAVVAAAAAPVV
jgi:hypothetical protein